MELTHLGQSTRYYSTYNPSLLEPILRHLGRGSFICDTSIGYDLWRLYEITYLNRHGIPKFVMGSIKIDASSQFTVESKSLKLYIGSFTQTRFMSLKHVQETIESDLLKITGTKPEVRLVTLEDSSFIPQIPQGECVDSFYDNLKPEFDTVSPHLLSFEQNSDCTETRDSAAECFAPENAGCDACETAKSPGVDGNDENAERCYYSNIVRTLCPVTSQPDFATVVIRYTGKAIDKGSLFAYLCSYRNHQGFHEACTENIYNDLKNILKVRSLIVKASFTRRGGIDINPCRADSKELADSLYDLRTLRQ